MNSAILNIAGLFLAVSGENSLQHIISLPRFSPFIVSNSSPVISKDSNSIAGQILFDSNDCISLGNSKPISDFPLEDGYAIAHLFNTNTGIVLTLSYPNAENPALVISKCTNSDIVNVSPCSDFSLLNYATWFAFSILSPFSSRIPIHSSVIETGSGAVLFLGESGTGKSTHTRLWTQYIPNSTILNDDSPILCVESDKIVVYGSPWSGKGNYYRNEVRPVKAIVRLSQAPANHIERLSVMEAFAAIYPSLPPCLAYFEDYSTKNISMVSSILKQVPVYHLACLPNADAARLCFNTIFS